MNSLEPLLNHLWQSTVFAGLLGLLTLLFRQNRAHVRHALWLAASLKFLVPLSLLIDLGNQIHWRRPVAPANFSAVVEQVSVPFHFPEAPHAAIQPVAADPLPFILLGIWALGFLAIGATWAIRWRRLAKNIRQGDPLDLALPIPALACSNSVEPGVFGIWRPVLVLPEGIADRLTPSQLATLIAHELHHVRRSDNFVAAFHMFVETAFWFHPLVWWIGKRMIEERERACDEAVLGAGNEPRVYAEAILNVCKLYTESPLVCVSGVTGANLKKRIEGIMTQRLIRDLNIARKLILAAAGVAAIAAPIAIGMIHAPRAQAQPIAATAVIQPASATPVVTPPVAARRAAPMPVPMAVAMAPFVAQGPTQSPEEARKGWQAEMKEHPFTNISMTGIYRNYGPPDQKIAFMSGPNQMETWRYNNIPAFHGNAEFEFVANGHGVRVNWPPPIGVFSAFIQDPAASDTLVQALSRELKLPASPAVQPGQLPGAARVETQFLYSVEYLATLSVPLNLYSSEVDLIGQVTEKFSDGSKDMVVANIRDHANPQPTYSTRFVVLPGNYKCTVLVREKSTGLFYTAVIPFEVTR